MLALLLFTASQMNCSPLRLVSIRDRLAVTATADSATSTRRRRTPPVSLVVCQRECYQKYAWLYHCLHRFRTERASSAHRRQMLRAFLPARVQDIAKILLCRSQLHPANIVDVFELRSNASRRCVRRATLQVCRFSDTRLQTAGVVVKTSNAAAKKCAWAAAHC